MAKPRDDRQKDLFRPPLDQIIDMGHPLVRLAGEIDWGFIDRHFAVVCRAGPAVLADAARRRAADAEARARALRRGALRAVGGESLFPILLR